MILLFSACALRAPAPLFAAPPMAMDPVPASEPFIEAADACEEPTPFIPGRMAPNVDLEGYPTCRAQLVPELWLHNMLRVENERDYWEIRSLACDDARQDDRALAQGLYNIEQTACGQLRQEVNWLRLATPVAYVVGVFSGGLVVIGAMRLSQ